MESSFREDVESSAQAGVMGWFSSAARMEANRVSIEIAADQTMRPQTVYVKAAAEKADRFTLRGAADEDHQTARMSLEILTMARHLVSEPTREWYRAHFSAIFSDFYLFDRLLGLTGPHLDARASDYLARLELDGKVQVENGVFSTTALSSGQHKRLALLISFLEDRPIYVFDEWAAAQDAHFRDIFYTVLVPELRRKGKGVIVISHDDRYYRLGDRTLRLTYGQMSP
jgi:ABC-type lipoprotein export system ATPase subunit